MDPVSLSLMASVGGSLASGLTGMAAAQGEKKRAEINSYVGRTRAIQSDTTARQGLEGELGSFRAALGANHQKPGVGTLEMVQELRDTRDRERRITVGNKMSEAADWRMAGKNAAAKGTGALVGGLIKAGPSLFSLYNYKGGG
jgi:hypothetical protein